MSVSPMKSLNPEGRQSYDGNGRQRSGNMYASEEHMADEHAPGPPPGSPGSPRPGGHGERGYGALVRRWAPLHSPHPRRAAPDRRRALSM